MGKSFHDFMLLFIAGLLVAVLVATWPSKKDRDSRPARSDRGAAKSQ